MCQLTLFDELAEHPEPSRAPTAPDGKPSLSAPYWEVDQIGAYVLGQELQGAIIPREAIPQSLQIHEFIWMELLCASICHQANWVQLHNLFLDLALGHPNVLQPTQLEHMSTASFVDVFGKAFDRERLRPKERSSMLRKVARRNLTWPVLSPFCESGPHQLRGEGGIYNWLASMDVFNEDPVQKKARVLVHQLLRYGALEVRDPENIAPAIDYHLMRLYARTGRVRPTSTETLDRLLTHQMFRVEFITHFRRAVEEAMWYTASGAQLRIDQLNHVEWQIARSFCVREGARCDGPYLASKPIDSSVAGLSSASTGACPLRSQCLGASDTSLRNIVDPISSRPFY